MTRTLPVLVAAALAGCAANAPTSHVAQVPVKFPLLDAAGITRTCDEGLARGREMVAAMESKAGGAGFLAEWNAFQIAFEDRTAMPTAPTCSSPYGVLSTAEYASQAGTSVKRDFVEAPSQMFEEWVRREQPLALYKKVCAECPPLAKADIDRLEGARRFGQGMGYSRQWMYAMLDMTLSTEPQPVAPLWRKLEIDSPLGHLEGTMKPSNFQHIAGSGYASGYYGYMWSEVIALDLLSPFEANMLDPKVGARYRDTILAMGSQEEEMVMVRKFLGRDPNPKAFFDEITGKR